MSDMRPGLDDPDYASFAWRRYRQIMGWMTLAAVLSAGGAVLALWLTLETLTLFVAAATALGVFFTVLMAAALMGLMFLSSGTGHDDQVEDPLAGEIDID